MKRAALFFILFLAFAGAPFLSAAHAAPDVTPTPATTQGFNPIPSAEEVGKIVDDKAKAGQTSKELYTINSQAILANGVTCMIMGCSTNPESGFYYGKSTIAGISNIMLSMYTNPPANLALWIRDTGESLGFIPKRTYAQGIGFTGLSVLLPIWKAFRNISYALLALVMVVIGFMVMFRKKIDPKTVVTVQNALPKIVFALLLITFSYAIAAFFIDLMYLTMSIIINLLMNASGGILGPDTASKYISGNLGTAFNALFGGGLSAIDDAMRLVFFSGAVPWYVNAALAVLTLGISLAGQLVVISLIIAVTLIFGIVRIAFLLISAYIQIILAVLIAPFQLLTEALPGSTGFSSWLKNLIANLAVFPITAGMLLIGTILTESNKGNVWSPPLLSGGGVTGITGIIGLGILLTIPNVANSVKEALKVKPVVGFGAGGGGGGLGQTLSTIYYVGALTPKSIKDKIFGKGGEG